MADQGLYVSTAGEYFHDKDALQEHYKSAFHRYNLKRKVAGLPPVTREWYEARKSQLAAAAAAAPAQSVWTDPLTKKRFFSENTYLAFTRSNKYKELVARNGGVAPKPVISARREREEGEASEAAGPGRAGAPAPDADASAPEPALWKPAGAGKNAHGVTAKRAVPSVAFAAAPSAVAAAGARGGEPGSDSEDGDESDAESDGSGWETVSDDEEVTAALEDGEEGGEEREKEDGEGTRADSEGEADASGSLEWVDWDPRHCLFDSAAFDSVEENLTYMHRTYGFFLPEAEFLVDPEGLLKYLGAKLAVGHIPLYVSGLVEHPRRFRSLHAVRRHMIDRVNCKLLWEGNEDEYEDYYDWGEGSDSDRERDDDEAEGAEAAAEPDASTSARDADGDGAPRGREDAADPAPSALVAAAEGGAQLARRGRAVYAPVAPPAGQAAAAYELAVPRAGGGVKVLGSREFARYYRQSHKAGEQRSGVLAARVLAQYRALAVAVAPTREVIDRRRAEKKIRRVQDRWMGISLRRNINDNLPKNVPY